MQSISLRKGKPAPSGQPEPPARETLHSWSALDSPETRSASVKPAGPDLASCGSVSGWRAPRRTHINGSGSPLCSSELYSLETLGSQDYPSVAHAGES